MATLLFKLTHVPDDEAEEVRSLLHEHNIHFYETTAGRWRVGLDAIWLPDDTQTAQARLLIDDYQQARSVRQREAYAELAAKGEAPTFGKMFAAHPIRFMGFVVAIVFVLALSTLPFWLA